MTCWQLRSHKNALKKSKLRLAWGKPKKVFHLTPCAGLPSSSCFSPSAVTSSASRLRQRHPGTLFAQDQAQRSRAQRSRVLRCLEQCNHDDLHRPASLFVPKPQPLFAKYKVLADLETPSFKALCRTRF